MVRVERGVMIVKDGKGWGKVYDDGQVTHYGWMELEKAPIHNSRYLRKPEDATYKNSPYIEELQKGKIVHVERTTTVSLNFYEKEMDEFNSVRF